LNRPAVEASNRVTYHVIEALDPAAALVEFAQRTTCSIS